MVNKQTQHPGGPEFESHILLQPDDFVIGEGPNDDHQSTQTLGKLSKEIFNELWMAG